MAQTKANLPSPSDADGAPPGGGEPAPRPGQSGRGQRLPRLETPGAVRIIRFRDGLTEVTTDPAEIASWTARPGPPIWIDLLTPEPATLDAIAATLDIHPLIAQDIAERNQRARVRIVDDIAHLVLFSLEYDDGVRETEIDLVLGVGFLLTVHDGDWDPAAAPVLRTGPEVVMRRGVDYLLWSLADSVVDGYFPVFDRLADEIDDLQDAVIASASPETLQRLFVMKRELLSIRRATSPAREVFNQLTNRDSDLIAEEHVVYFRDIYDHLLRVTDELDNYRELVSGTLEVYLSTVNNTLSLIMKRLTGVTVILAGIGAIAGIFGMSEAGTAFAGGEASGFWMVAGMTIVLAAITVVVLRRIDWI